MIYHVNSLESCEPYNISWEREGSGVNVLWNTKENCLGFLKYGVKKDSINSTAVQKENNTKKRNHVVYIEGVKGDLYLIVYSDQKAYGSLGLPIVISVN